MRNLQRPAISYWRVPWMFPWGAVPSHAAPTFLKFTAIYVQEIGGRVLIWGYVYFIPNSIQLYRVLHLEILRSESKEGSTLLHKSFFLGVQRMTSAAAIGTDSNNSLSIFMRPIIYDAQPVSVT